MWGLEPDFVTLSSSVPLGSKDRSWLRAGRALPLHGDGDDDEVTMTAIMTMEMM